MLTAGEDRRVRRGSYGWVIMGLFWALNAATFSLVHSLGIFLPAISADLALGPVSSGWLGSIYFLLMCLLSLILSSWLSRYQPYRVVLVTAIAGSILIFVQGWAPNFAVALAARAAFVVMVIARMPAGLLIMQRWFPPGRLPLVNSVAMIAADGSLAIAMTALPFAINLLQGWRNTYYAFGIISILASLVWLALGNRHPATPHTAPPRSQERSPLRSVFRYKETWLLGTGVFGATATWAGFSVFWPTFATTTLGVPLGSTGFILGLSSAGAVAGYLVCSSLAMRTGRRKLFLVVPGLALPLLNLASLWTGSTLLLSALSLGKGFAWIFLPVVMTVPFELPNIKPREVTVATALIMTLMSAGGATGPLLVGFLTRALGSLYPALAVLCALPLTLTVAGLLLPETGRAKATVPEDGHADH